MGMSSGQFESASPGFTAPLEGLARIGLRPNSDFLKLTRASVVWLATKSLVNHGQSETSL